MDKYILAVDTNGKLQVFVPVASGLLRDLAKALINLADNAMIGPNVEQQEEVQDETT